MQAQRQHCVAPALPCPTTPGRSTPPHPQWPEGRSVLWLLSYKISLEPPLVSS